jgi:uncharacterized protein HemX
MKFEIFLICIAIILMGIFTLFRIEDRKMKNRLDAIQAETKRIIQTDSIQDARTAFVIDSLRRYIDANDQDIVRLKTQVSTLRKRNEKLFEMVNSVRVDVPEPKY